MIITLDQIIAARKKYGYPIFEGIYNVMITGIRDTTDNIGDDFNDLITVSYQDENKKWKLYSFAATTDPGQLFRTNSPYPEQQANGVAILKAGHYPASHTIGYHGGGSYRHKALIQTGNLTVYRDNNKDLILDWNDKSKIQTGNWFGINIHKAWVNGKAPKIGNTSAGCQVIADSLDFSIFLEVLSKSAKLYGNTFSYTLLNWNNCI